MQVEVRHQHTANSSPKYLNHTGPAYKKYAQLWAGKNRGVPLVPQPDRQENNDTLSREYFCATWRLLGEGLSDLLLSSSLYGHWLPKIQLSGAFRSRLLGFVFKLENSLFYVSSLKFTDVPESCRLSRSRWGAPLFTPLIRSRLALLYFTVTTICKFTKRAQRLIPWS